MNNFFISFFMNIGKFFQRKNYELIKTTLVDKIASAELQFQEGQPIKDKKEWVTNQVMEKVDNKFLKFILRFTLPALIDQMVDALNETLGHDWVNHLDGYFEIIEAKFPFLKE